MATKKRRKVSRAERVFRARADRALTLFERLLTLLEAQEKRAQEFANRRMGKDVQP